MRVLVSEYLWVTNQRSARRTRQARTERQGTSLTEKAATGAAIQHGLTMIGTEQRP